MRMSSQKLARARCASEALPTNHYAWFAAPAFERGETLRIANLAPPCGVRAVAIRALDAAGIAWSEAFVGGGVAAVTAAVTAGLAVAALARRIAPVGCIDVGPKLRLPRLPRARVMLYSRVSDARGRAAFRVLAAAFRGMAASG